jgi:hypothetical protein
MTIISSIEFESMGGLVMGLVVTSEKRNNSEDVPGHMKWASFQPL